MTQRNRKTTDERSYAAPEDGYSSAEGGSSPAGAQHQRQMALLRIRYDGLRYHRNGYRYDRLEDAVAYARLMGSRPCHEDTVGAYASPMTFAPPTDTERSLMASLAIRFEEGAYRHGAFRYDKLSDAVNQAKFAPARHDDDRA
jgi:hypothetical protein